MGVRIISVPRDSFISGYTLDAMRPAITIEHSGSDIINPSSAGRDCEDKSKVDGRSVAIGGVAIAGCVAIGGVAIAGGVAIEGVW